MDHDLYLKYSNNIRKLYSIKYRTQENNWIIYSQKSVLSHNAIPVGKDEIGYRIIVESRLFPGEKSDKIVEMTGYYMTEEAAFKALISSIVESAKKELSELERRKSLIEELFRAESELNV